MLASIWALLAGRAVSAVSGPFGRCIAYGVAAFILVLGLAWGIHAIREDAREDVRAEFRARQALAQVAANKRQEARVRASEEVAAKHRAELADELAKAVQRAAELEAELATIPKGVAYPASIAKRLSQ